MDIRQSIDNFIKASKRVLKVSKKPTGEEYKELAKISAIGVVIIGGIGYLFVMFGSLIGI